MIDLIWLSGARSPKTKTGLNRPFSTSFFEKRLGAGRQLDLVQYHLQSSQAGQFPQYGYLLLSVTASWADYLMKKSIKTDPFLFSWQVNELGYQWKKGINSQLCLFERGDL